MNKWYERYGLKFLDGLPRRTLKLSFFGSPFQLSKDTNTCQFKMRSIYGSLWLRVPEKPPKKYSIWNYASRTSLEVEREYGIVIPHFHENKLQKKPRWIF